MTAVLQNKRNGTQVRSKKKTEIRNRGNCTEGNAIIHVPSFLFKLSSLQINRGAGLSFLNN